MRKILVIPLFLIGLSPFFSDSFKQEIIWWNNRQIKYEIFEIEPAWLKLPDGQYGLDLVVRF